jgi:transcriptional regulator with XRE-family HTH domain
MARREADRIDKLVGRNIRVLRLKKGMPQTELGAALGLTFQQIQKYEKGVNRIGSGRLYKIAVIFNVPVASLFEGSDTSSGKEESIYSMLADPTCLRLVEAMAEIEDASVRRSIAELAEKIASGQTRGNRRR